MYCPWCVSQIEDGLGKCPCCGKDNAVSNADNALPIGTILSDRYYVGTVLGQGGFGITYVGCDTRLNKKVAIKEYFPVNLVSRLSEHSTHLTVNAGDQALWFERERKRFINEAQLLAEFASDRNVVGVTDILEENNTAYIVMEYVEGENLKDYIQNHGTMTFADALKMLDPMLDSLSVMHSKGLIHRDISPDNIMVQPDKHVILIDFGSTRGYGIGEGMSVTVTVKHGYAPFEQYSTSGRQGPWTDVYALCATLYWMITGAALPSAIDRIAGHELKKPAELGAVIDRADEYVLMNGLAILPEKRYPSIAELDKAFWDAADSSRESSLHNGTVIHEEQPKAPQRSFETKSDVYESTEILHEAVSDTSDRENPKGNHLVSKKSNGSDFVGNLRRILAIVAIVLGIIIAAILFPQIYGLDIGFNQAERTVEPEIDISGHEFELAYLEDDYQNEVWYLYDNTEGYRVKVFELLEAYASYNGEESSKEWAHERYDGAYFKIEYKVSEDGKSIGVLADINNGYRYDLQKLISAAYNE